MQIPDWIPCRHSGLHQNLWFNTVHQIRVEGVKTTLTFSSNHHYSRYIYIAACLCVPMRIICSQRVQYRRSLFHHCIQYSFIQIVRAAHFVICIHIYLSVSPLLSFCFSICCTPTHVYTQSSRLPLSFSLESGIRFSAIIGTHD